MRAVVQRVSSAAVEVEGDMVGAIGMGLCILLGVGPDDTDTVADHLARRIASLRIFPDHRGRMNLDVVQAHPPGAALVISQFTLYADTSRGHRPAFVGAADPDLARRLYRRFCDSLRALGLEVAEGRFGAAMRLRLVNEGPVTLVLSSGEGPWPTDAG